MKIAIIGTGYVGLVTGACFAKVGHDVICVDVIAEKVEKINNAIPPIYEEGLEELLKELVPSGKLKATLDLKEAVKESEVIFIAVGTPSRPDGSMDYSYVEEAARGIGRALKKDQTYRVVVVKSTCIPGTTMNLVRPIIEEESGLKAGEDFGLGMNPEFLREGVAIKDFLEPDRIVIGGIDKKSKEVIAKCYENFKAPILFTSTTAAEMIKYAANAFLALKISYINEIANLCEKLGIDVKEVAKGIGLDHRISEKFLNAGAGWGGSCFHPDEVVFVDFGNGLECVSFRELFVKLNNGFESPVKILSADEKLNLKLVELNTVTKRDYSDELIVLKTSMGRGIKVTKDHPIVIIKEGKLTTKLAEDVEVGDEIILPFGDFINNVSALSQENENTFSNNGLIVIDVLEEIKNTSLLDDTYLNNKEMVMKEFEVIKEHLSNKDPYDVKRNGTVRAKDIMLVKDIIDKYEGNKLFTVRNGVNTIPSKITINEEFARLLGYYIAEGWISEDSGRHNSIRKRIGFSFGDKEIEYITDVRDVLNKLGINYIERVKDGSHTVIVSSRLLAYILEEVLHCGHDSYTKNIPPQIFNSPEKIKWAFLKGVIRGDRGLVRLNDNRNLNIEYGTVSKKLANGLIILLQSLGFTVSLKTCYNNKSTTPAYILRINGINQIRRIGPLFGDKWNDYKEIANNYKRNIKSIGYTKFDNYAVVKIRSVERESYNGEVYSVETENNLLISSHGILIHNCFPKDVKALLHKSKELSRPLKTIQAALEVNEKQPLRTVELLKEELKENLKDRIIAVLGLAFKPNTDDMREAPSIKIITQLLSEGAIVKATDPAAMENAKKILKHENLIFVETAEEALKDAEGCILITEWQQFKQIPASTFLEKMKNPIVIDGRRAFNYREFIKKGIKYRGIGLGL